MQVCNLSTFEQIFLSVLSAKINTVYITYMPKTRQYIKIIPKQQILVPHWYSDVACLPWCTVPAR